MRIKLTYEEVKLMFEAEGCTLLSTEYKNGRSKLEFICHCGRKSVQAFKVFRKSKQCKQCGYESGGKKHKYNLDEIREYLKYNNCTLLSTEYINCKQKIEYICSCGNMASRTFDKIINRSQKGVGCKECQKQKLSKQKLLSYEFVKSYFEENGCTLLSKEYKGNRFNLDYICVCGDKASISFAAFKDQGQRCKKCGEIKRAKSYSKAGGVTKLDVCFYDTYEKHISYAEETRRAPDNNEILEVRCAYCGEWLKPTLNQMWHRITALNGKCKTPGAENRFYCSKGCKQDCPVFGAVERPKGLNPDKTRPGQSEFREMVLERDNYTCQICGHHDPCGEFLVAHHVDPVACNPIESMDVDNGVTLCNDCHQHAHNLPGCSTSELRAASYQL